MNEWMKNVQCKRIKCSVTWSVMCKKTQLKQME